MNISHLTLDVYDDETAELAQKVALLDAGAVALVPSAPEDLTAAADHRFAAVFKTSSGIIRRKWPLITEDDAKLSWAYFTRVRELLPDEIVDATEAKFAAMVGELDGKGLSTAVNYVDLSKIPDAPEPKVAAAPVYGAVIDGVPRFPLHTEAHIKQAMDAWPRTISTLTPAERWTYANGIAKQAAALALELDPRHAVNEYLGTAVNRGTLKTAVEARRRYLTAQGLPTEALDKLAFAAGVYIGGELDSLSGEAQAWVIGATELTRDLEKNAGALPATEIAELLCTMDKIAGIRDYGTGMPDPYAAVFAPGDITRHDPVALVDGVNLAVLKTAEGKKRLLDFLDAKYVDEVVDNPSGMYRNAPSGVQEVLRQATSEPRRAVDNSSKFMSGVRKRMPADFGVRPATDRFQDSPSSGSPESTLDARYSHGIGDAGLR